MSRFLSLVERVVGLQKVPQRNQWHAMFEALGALTVTWAAMELALDTLVAIAHGNGGSSFEPEIPHSLSRKLSFLRRCTDRIPALAPHKAAAEELFDEISELSDKRHLLILGFATNMATKMGVSIEFERVRYLPTAPKAKGGNSSAEEIIDLCDLAIRQFTNVLRLTRAVDIALKPNPEQALRKL